MSEHFVLRSSLTSPFGRKVRIAVDALGLADHVERVDADTMDPTDSLRHQNPLGKVPTLIRADGSVIFDSGVIIEFLQDVANTTSIVPTKGDERYRILTQARLADGITEAALLMVYEGRYRDHDHPAKRWIENQHGKIMRALAAFDSHPPDSKQIDLVTIGLSCALAYLDFRKPVEWRTPHPNLAQWLEDFSSHHPIFIRTRPPEAH